MRKFVVSLFIIVIGLFVVDRIGGEIMWWVNQNTHDVSGPKIKYLANNVKEEVLLMGTSRCNLHYVPSIIEDSLNMTVYNGGIDASNNIYAHYITLNYVLNHHKPKVVCLELMTSDFAKEENPYNTVTFFAPYVGLNDNADDVFKDAGLYWKYQMSHLYRYNAKAMSNIAGLFVNRQEGGDNGYIPLPKPSHFPDEISKDKLITEIDDNKIHYLSKFIDICKQNDIKLVFMVSPKCSFAAENEYKPLKQLAIKYNIPFIDYHSKGLFLDHLDYFKDTNHLWDKSARLYSAIFAHDLKNIIFNLGL